MIVEEEINKISDKYFIDRWRKKERKYHIQEDSDGNSTHELLRFNMLSRKAVILTSKGTKTEEGMQYLDEEFDRLNKHLDFLMQEKERQTTSMITGESEVHQGEERTNSNTTEIVILQEPNRIQQKGRPKNPTKLKPLVEQERAKMAKAAANKKKTQQQTSSPVAKSKKKMRRALQ